MKQHRHFYFLLTALLSLSVLACKPKSGESTTQENDRVRDSLEMAFPVHLKYAQGLTIENFLGYKVMTVFEPDTRDTMQVYTFHLEGVEVPLDLQQHTKMITVPASTLACHSTTQIGALPLLDLIDVLVGATGIRNIYHPEIRQRIQEGLVRSTGEGMGKNLEQILAVNPDIMLQDYTSATEKDEDLERSGIHFVLYNEWKEYTLLGRAEWMKVIGILFGRNRLADEQFNEIEQQYLEAKKAVAGESESLPIMYGQDYKGMWYIPGEKSFMNQMFQDAKLAFECAEGRVSSVPTGFEVIFTNHRHAKFWFTMAAGEIHTVKDFVALNERYAHFDAVKEGKVFINRKRLNEFGGNDFWESGLYRPDLLLKDAIKLTRPNLLPGYEPVYWFELARETN